MTKVVLKLWYNF